MSYIESIVYGLIQGLTEFLPVSSSGHLALAQAFFGLEDVEKSHFALNILLHFGTLLAVFAAYGSDIWKIITQFFAAVRDLLAGRFTYKNIPPELKLGLAVAVAVLPAVLLIPIKDVIEQISQSTLVVGALLIVNGLMLYASDRVGRRGKSEKDIKLLDALTVGFVQVIAALPGISRSGSTITGGLVSGFSRELAVKFSFILSIPTILGANVVALKDVAEQGMGAADIGPYIVGVLAAAAAGFLAIRLVRWVAKNDRFSYFAVYCIVVGAAAVAASLIR